MAIHSLEPVDLERDTAFNQALHRKSALNTGLTALLSKDHNAHSHAVNQYFKHWDNKPSVDETEDVRKSRRAEHATLTRYYYDLVTDLYEYGWAQSFHFCRFSKGEAFRHALARHEHYLALKMQLREDMKVLDVGCGIGGPAREIAKFCNVNITGLNNNDYQIERAIRYTQREQDISRRLTYVKGDFMQMPFADSSFDAIYAIEATVHAPSLAGVYAEIFRVLKPGGVFGVYEWVMTGDYDNDDARHRELRPTIERGNGISNMEKVEVALAAMEGAGFRLKHHGDLAARPGTDPYPWYYPLTGDLRYMQSLWDLPKLMRMTHVGRGAAHTLVGVLERVGLAPDGTRKTAEAMARAADGLVEGGRRGLFTPMYMMIGRKPGEERVQPDDEGDMGGM